MSYSNKYNPHIIYYIYKEKEKDKNIFFIYKYVYT